MNGIHALLSQLIVDLDGAILQAVTSPLHFSDGFLKGLPVACSALTGLDEVWSRSEATIGAAKDLIWQVRERAGRLRMLLDSAAQFHSSCFSLSQTEGMQYGMHGEWKPLAGLNRLAIDG